MSSVRVRYKTFEIGVTELHVRSLLDNNQFEDDDGRAESLGVTSAQWPIFGMLWPSGEVLMRLIAETDIAGRRVLEVGCGIGLASLWLNHKNEDVTATDIHPEVEAFMLANTELNGDDAIPFVRGAWGGAEAEALGQFDLIIGSDVLYERPMVDDLSAFIERHAKPTCEVIIIDPGRSHCGHFRRALKAQGFADTQQSAGETPYLAAPYNGRVLRFTRQGATPVVDGPK